MQEEAEEEYLKKREELYRKREKQREEQKKIKEFKKTLKEFIMTTRYNNQTWEQNQRFRKTYKIPSIYGTPQRITENIPYESTIYMLEMNNEINKIVGIGRIKNHYLTKKYEIYDNQNFNRYQYKGKQHIYREQMTEEEEQIMQVFDRLCFTGYKHMKRGANLKSFPAEMLYRCVTKANVDLIARVREMFIKRFMKTT
jgi:hypothetical protein